LRNAIRRILLESDFRTSVQGARLANLGYFRQPKYEEELNIPEDDLPRAWKELLAEYEWIPGYGFQHKEQGWWMPQTRLPGFSSIGLDVSPMAWAYEPMIGLKPAKEKRNFGRKEKAKFSKSYEKNREFFDSLTYIHWKDDFDELADMIKNPRLKDEVSVGWYDTTPYKAGDKKFGLVLKGRPTIVSNDNLKSGREVDSVELNPDQFLPSFYMVRGGQRSRSSGINKYPAKDVVNFGGIVHEPKNADLARIEIFRNKGFGYNNEALLDNWEIESIIVASILPRNEIKNVYDLADEYGVQIIDENGKVIYP